MRFDEDREELKIIDRLTGGKGISSRIYFLIAVNSILLHIKF